MDPQRWTRIESLYHAAVAKDRAERSAYLDAACAQDPELRGEVESLLGCADAELVSPVAGEYHLAPSFRLGSYEILAPLGRGGMGEVYRARDTKLRREVAIKVLPREFQSDPERLARFEREAQVLASLNHPNIGAIYGLEEFQGTRFLVLELVEGPTLAGRIARGAVSREETLGIAKQTADALEYAHERNVVHRDLKPANIKLTADGHAKVLDFGLAKALADPTPVTDPSNSPTVTIGGTAVGVVLGTAAYMSPEQATGRSLDKRTDIWSFGVVLYEMLTGKQLFGGESVTVTLANVLKEQPDFHRVPTKFRPLLQKCLEKDRTNRLRDIGDWVLLLDEHRPAAPPRGALWARLGILASTIAALIAASVFGFLYFRKPAEPQRVIRLSLLPPENTTFVPEVPAVSPDGQHIVFIGQTGSRFQLWVRDLDSPASRRLPGTEGGVRPFWSPDSRAIGFFADGKLKRVDLAGGPAQVICDSTSFFGIWSKSNVILFTPRYGGIFRVPASGGTPAPVTDFDRKTELFHAAVQFLPDGRHFIYGVLPKKAGAYVGDVDSKTRRRLPGAGAFQFYASGYLLSLQDQSLMAQPFDLDKLAVTGDPMPVADPVAKGGPGFYSVSQNGVLVYFPAIAAQSTQLMWFDRSGKPVGTVGSLRNFGRIAVSRDETAVAFNDNGAIWLHDLVHGGETRLAPRPINNVNPVWSPDGRQFAFGSIEHGGIFQIYQTATAGTAQEVALDVDARSKFPTDWSLDGRYIIEQVTTKSDAGNEIWVLPLFGDRKAYPYLRSEFDQKQAKLSRDGRWLAYVSNESTRDEVHVVSFPKPERQWTISTGGGDRPIWSRDGKELFFLSLDGKMMAAEIKAGAQFDFTPPKSLFDVRIPPFATYDVSKDGRFLIPVPVGQGAAGTMNVVINWPAALRH